MLPEFPGICKKSENLFTLQADEKRNFSHAKRYLTLLSQYH